MANELSRGDMEEIKGHVYNECSEVKWYTEEYELVNTLLNMNGQLAMLKTELYTRKSASFDIISSALANIEIGFDFIKARTKDGLGRVYHSVISALKENISAEINTLRNNVNIAKKAQINSKKPPEENKAVDGTWGSTFGD